MPLWDVELEETRSRTVVVDAHSRAEALRLAGQGRASWLDRGRADTVHIEVLGASPQTSEAVEADCMDVAKWDMEGMA